MKQRYIVAGAWGRINGDTGQAEVKAVLTGVMADSEGEAVSLSLKIGTEDPAMLGWTLDSFCVRPLISLI